MKYLQRWRGLWWRWQQPQLWQRWRQQQLRGNPNNGDSNKSNNEWSVPTTTGHDNNSWGKEAMVELKYLGIFCFLILKNEGHKFKARVRRGVGILTCIIYIFHNQQRAIGKYWRIISFSSNFMILLGLGLKRLGYMD